MVDAQKKRLEIRRVTVTGLVLNILLMAFKITAGTLGRSQAVFADGIHSGSDLVTDMMVLLGLAFWARPKDADHPYGHERIETVVALVLSGVLFAAGALIGYEAVSQLWKRHIVHIRPIALYAALVSVFSKEVLYRWTRRVGVRMKSLAVVANAWHHRTDAFSSIPVAVAVGTAILLPSWWFVDHVAAVLVSLLIAIAAYGIALPCVRQLIDTAPPRQIQEALAHAMESTDGVISVHEIRARYLGPKILAEAHIEVDGRLTVDEGHDIAEEAKKKVFEQFPEIEDITIHIEPVGDLLIRGEA
jgi:cation diffusion facilitator family transporter